MSRALKQHEDDGSVDSAIERYRLAIPHELQARQLWLVWRFESASEPGKKPLKVPYYVATGARRSGEQGAPEDLAKLATFDAALEALRSGRWSGLGLAHVPGCGLNSWDFDNCVDDQGEIDPGIWDLIHASGTYAETSPSGRGIRMIALGSLPSIKRIHPGGYNIECFGESGFVTVTARTICGDRLATLPAPLLQTLRAWIQADQAQPTRQRGERLEAVKAADFVYQKLKADARIKHEHHDGRIGIVCPFAAEHTSGAGLSDTVYFLPNTHGYQRGHFRCLHAHCAQRSDDDFIQAIGAEPPIIDLLAKDAPTGPYVRAPIDWAETGRNPPPARTWAIEQWLGVGYMTLLAGRGGVGKTLLMQQISSAVALGKRFLGEVLRPRKVLMWCAEDDADELKRRQLAIAEWLGVPIGLFGGHVVVESLAGIDCSLATLDRGNLTATRMASELWQQINDYQAEVFALDNIAHLYGGNENDRHQVTQFASMLTGMAIKGHAAGILAGHPGKSTESEFSGSTAWENAVRARLYLSRTPPDTDDQDADPAGLTRYLSKRKTNYSALDCQRMTYQDGALRPDESGLDDSPLIRSLTERKAREVVLRAVTKLKEMGVFCASNQQASNFLPKLITKFQLAEGMHSSETERAMRQLMVDGKLAMGVVGKYANRADRVGLVVP